MNTHEFTSTPDFPQVCIYMTPEGACGLFASADVHMPETPQQEVDRLSDELAASREQFNREIGASPVTEDRATSRPLDEALTGLDGLRVIVTSIQWSVEGGTDVTGWGQCPECGSADWEGHQKDCVIPKTLTRFDHAREQIVNSYTASQKRINKLTAALTKIRDIDECGCEHDNENCCAVVDYPCGTCIAAAALKAEEYQEVKR